MEAHRCVCIGDPSTPGSLQDKVQVGISSLQGLDILVAGVST